MNLVSEEQLSASPKGFQIVIFRLPAVGSVTVTGAYVVPGPSRPFYSLY